MASLAQDVVTQFNNHFGQAPEFVFHAPGRVNLIGEHTDYNEGFVFPCAIDLGTYMAISLRDDNKMKVIASNIDNQESEWISELPLQADENHSWANYIRGVNEQFLKHHSSIKGMNVVVLGNIPQGSGLSSSASFSVAFASAINQINDIGLSPTQVALLCQTSENEFVGCKCGIMDQLISAAGEAQSAVLIDCRDLSCKPVKMPNDMQVIIINSKVTRGLVDSEYNARREQCEAAAKQMQANSLRDVSLETLQAHKDKLDPVTYKRAHHVITENQRTLDSAQAIEEADYATLSKLMSESHISMRDDFQITTSQIDYLVDIVGKVLGDNGGVRMTGGGFGGCVVAVAPQNYSQAVIDTIEANYAKETGLNAEIYLCEASAGASQIQ